MITKESKKTSLSLGWGPAMVVFVLCLVGSASGQLPEGWYNMDIGSPSAPGSASYDNGTDTWTIDGDGHDIWGNSDAFHYVYKALPGDGSITARVVSITGEGLHEWAKAGVMVRETLDESSRHAMIMMTPSNGATFQWRSETGGLMDHSTEGGLSAPYWVRIQRRGNSLRAYSSTDGQDWAVRGYTVINMAAVCYIGLAVTSHQDSVLCTAKFDNVMTAVGGEIFIPQDTSVGTWDSVNRTYTLATDVSETIQIEEDNLILNGDGHLVSGPGWGFGVYLNGRTGVTIHNLNVQWFYHGICLSSSSNNTIIDNTVMNNYDSGIYLDSSTSNNILQGNVCSNNSMGIHLFSSGGNTLTGNTMYDNVFNFALRGYWLPNDNDIDTTNTVNGKPIYYVKNVVGGVYDSSTNAGTFYAINCSNITIKDLTLTSNSYEGVLLVKTQNSRIENVTASNNFYGISLMGVDSTNNTVTDNTVSNNFCGITLWESNDNTVRDNTVNSNRWYGIEVWSSSNNEVYNNNFVNNMVQAHVFNGAGNIFNLAKPIGGNFWSDWTGPDANGDGFVDYPYVFEGGQDNLPLADDDLDGVTDVVEDGAPNGGDGNSDGTADGQQNNVASLPNAVDGEYVTLVSPDQTSLVGVIAVENPSPEDPPEGVDFPIGFFEFTIRGITPGGATTSTLLLPPGETVETYYKYGPTPGNPADHWYEFLYNGTTGAEIFTDSVVLHFVDGQRGDDDLTANCEVVEPGAPGLLANHPPVARITLPSSGFIEAVNTPINFVGEIDDLDVDDTHTSTWTMDSENLAEPIVVEGTVDGYIVRDELDFLDAGIYSITLTVTDAAGASDEATTVNNDPESPAFVVIYNPDGGFVTGGGWVDSPAGAYKPDTSMTGKANFGFVSKYKKGATIPTGNTEFVFHAGNLNFHSSSYEWLVVTGSNYARFKGSGTINGEGDYKFMLWAGDGEPDTFRIRIWTEDEGGVETDVYDNGFDQAIGGGSIVIHTN